MTVDLTSFQTGIPALDPDALLAAARSQLGITDGSLRSWRWRSIWNPRLESTAGVYRIDSVIQRGAGLLDSTLVLKAMAWSEAQAPPREATLYASGVLGHLPPGLRAPRWHGTMGLGTGCVGVWLDVERDDPDVAWDVERFGIVARHLGRLAGSSQPRLREQAGARPIRTFRRDTANVERTVRAFADASAHGLAGRAWPGPTRQALMMLWSTRESLPARSELLPVTLCHGDAQRRNLFARRDATVAIDWANFGMAPVGMDIATLVHYALAYFDVAINAAMDLERSLLDGYTRGLEDEGVSIDRDTIWIGYAMQMVSLGLLETGPVLRLANDPGSHEQAEAFYGQSIDAIMDRRRDIARYLIDLGSRMERANP